MKLYVFKLKAANPQYDAFSEITIADVCESVAIEKAEEIVGCALNICEWLGMKEFNDPCVITNTFE